VKLLNTNKAPTNSRHNVNPDLLYSPLNNSDAKIGKIIATSISHEKLGKIPTKTAHINAHIVIANERNTDFV
jgi:hypothetical protein